MAMKMKKTIGTRREVFNGTAKKTSGGLEKKDLIKNKLGRIVSKKKHITAKKEKRLVKYGYGAKKGSFGYVRVKKPATRRRRTSYKKRRNTV